MKYRDGQDVRLGDRLKLGEDNAGIVVASVDADEHPRAKWSQLIKGLMIEFPQYGLIHYEEP